MPKKLSNEEIDELKQWLENQHITLPFHKMHREYSDSVAVAQLLKKLYPRLIDLHNYPSRNNTQLKLINWETLNSKALCKLGLQQSKATLEKLARATAGAIELLLFEIMMQEREQRIKEEKLQQETENEQQWSENDDILIVNINKKVGDGIVQVPQKMILYSIYEQTMKECSGKDAIINSAQQKVAHLEHLLKLKGERIDELCSHVAKLSMEMNPNYPLSTSCSEIMPPSQPSKHAVHVL